MPAMLLANQIMEKEYKEPEEIDYSKIKTKRLSLRNLKKLEGFYYDKTNSIVREIYVKNDTLRYKRVESNRETPMLALSNNKFQLYQRGDIEVFITFTNNTFEISSLNSDVSIYDKVNIVESSALRLSDYSGHYYNKELDVILKFSLEENALTTSSLRINPIRFYPIIKDSFRSNTFIFSGIQFTREDDIVSGFNINTDGVSNLYFEKIKWN